MSGIRGVLRALGAWLVRDVGRLYAGIVGGGLAIAGLMLSPNRNTVANTALVVGGALVALGGLVPWFRRARWKHGSLEFEDPEIQRERARSALRVSEEQRTPGVNLGALTALDATRVYTATQALVALFKDTARNAPEFAKCDFRLFMYDALKERLVAVLSATEQREASREWRIGEGVTGVAYREAEYVIAAGEATHDDTFDLDTNAQEYYSDLTEVAAAPVLNVSRKVIGVLSVSHSEDSTILDTTVGRRVHNMAAAGCARIIVDLLGWRSDD